MPRKGRVPFGKNCGARRAPNRYYGAAMQPNLPCRPLLSHARQKHRRSAVKIPGRRGRSLHGLVAGLLLLTHFGGQLQAERVAPAPGGEWLVSGGSFNVLSHDRQGLASVEYRLAAQKGNLRPWLGAAASANDAWFLSAGLLYTVPAPPDARWRFSLGFAPSYYQAGRGLQLGQHLEFYSFAEVGRAFRDGRVLNLRFGHLSNANLADHNPGAEVLQFGYAWHW